MIELAQSLKSRRLAQGLSLADVAENAGVAIGLLKALEGGQFTEIGPSSLVDSLLSAYARALENGQPSVPEAPEPQPAAEVSVPPEPSPAAPLRSPRKTLTLSFLSILLLALVAIGTLYWWQGMIPSPAPNHSPHQAPLVKVVPEPEQSAETPPDATVIQDPDVRKEPPLTAAADQVRETPRDPEPAPADKTDEEAVSPAVSAGLTEARENTPTASTGNPHLFEIEALQPSWVQVKSDNKKTEGALLQPGERRTWAVTQEILIVIGNAGGVRMLWDGTPVDLGGKPGQVLRFRLPHELPGKSP